MMFAPLAAEQLSKSKTGFLIQKSKEKK